jgi:preprotein translocase subunit SecG
MLYLSAMKTISTLLPYIQIGLAVLMVLAIILQQTGAQIGGAFGGSDNFSSAFHTRRGAEKTLFIVTIVLAILFAVSALVTLL